MQEVGSRKGGRWAVWRTVTSGFGDINMWSRRDLHSSAGCAPMVGGMNIGRNRAMFPSIEILNPDRIGSSI